ncbi:MAG: hypothetical protein N3A38_11290 [Planctomycetota bacterium]|nr:hypothetical protein [Planctomycetota bacterium]
MGRPRRALRAGAGPGRSLRGIAMSSDVRQQLLIGWASRDVTPQRPVLLRGQFYARVSEGVMDPLTVTALALESVRDGRPEDRAILVSCDYVNISGALLAAVRERVRERLPDLDPHSVCLNATHTHTGPDTGSEDPLSIGSLPPMEGLSEEALGVMRRAEHLAFAAERIAGAVEEAWRSRAPGGIGFGLGHAVVGHNRRVSYYTGQTRMYGKTDDPEFSHIEGGADHSVNLLCTWDAGRKLTGMVVNVACPSQVSEHLWQISADYWHEARVEIRGRFGAGLFILPQCGAAGDQSPHIQVGRAAEERMWRLTGRTQRQEIAVRIADAVSAIMLLVEKDIDRNPIFAHRVEMVELPLRPLSEGDVREARAEAEKARASYEALRKDLESHPEKTRVPRWYKDISAAYSRMLWNLQVERRFEELKARTARPVEIHVLRLGAVAFATNPFECYLDFGLQIKARSRAVQTFVVQLAGGDIVGSYLPTDRAAAGGSYGAIPASTPFGPEAGRLLVDRTVELINGLFR